MSDLPEMLKKLKYDKRMLNWNLRQKLLTEKEYQKHLKSLKDLSHLKSDVPIEDEEEEKEQATEQEQEQEQETEVEDSGDQHNS